MGRLIIYKRDGGGIDILKPTVKKKKGIDEISFLKTVAEKSFPGRKYNIISDDFLKTPGFKQLMNEFRNALILTDYGIDFDLEKCKLIWLERIRDHRNRQLKELDIEFMKAVEDGDEDSVKEIGDLKKILRELPQDFLKFKFNNIYELKSCWPDILQPIPQFVVRR